MGAGIIQATSISGSLDARQIVMGVLTHAYDNANLKDIARMVDVPKLEATVPIMTGPGVEEDLDELEATPFNNGKFNDVKFSLKKDRVYLAVSDEAQYRSDQGDPLQLQVGASGDALARVLDKKIALALQTNPQTGASAGAWSTVTNNPLKDLASAVGKVRPYKADFVVMTTDVWTAFVANDYTAKFATGAPEKLEGVVTVIPGLNLKVYISDDITAKSILVGASGAPAVAVGNGPVKVRNKDLDAGGTMYQVDVWRQAKAPIMVNDASKNVAVCQRTAVIA